jgi:hypothetical protein
MDLDLEPSLLFFQVLLIQPRGKILSPLRSCSLSVSLLQNKVRIHHIVTKVTKNDPLTGTEVSNTCTCRILIEVWVTFIDDMLGTPLVAGEKTV